MPLEQAVPRKDALRLPLGLLGRYFQRLLPFRVLATGPSAFPGLPGGIEHAVIVCGEHGVGHSLHTPQTIEVVL